MVLCLHRSLSYVHDLGIGPCCPVQTLYVDVLGLLLAIHDLGNFTVVQAHDVGRVLTPVRVLALPSVEGLDVCDELVDLDGLPMLLMAS